MGYGLHNSTRIAQQIAKADSFTALYATFTSRYALNHASAARALKTPYRNVWQWRVHRRVPGATAYALIRVYLDIDDDAYIAAQCELGQGTPTFKLPRKARKAKPRKRPATPTNPQA